MSICNSCRTPGNCCKGFGLNLNIPKENWEYELDIRLKVNKIQFLVPRRAPFYDTEHTLGFQFDCSLLDSNGRCSNYESRPQMCKDYQPQQDPLCCEYTRTLKGIPIVERKYNAN